MPRIAGLVVIGTTPLPGLRFAALNALGALLWACVIAGIGWVFGQAVQAVLGEIRHLEPWLLLELAVTAAVAWRIRKRRAN